MDTNRLGEVTDYLLSALQTLARAGADFGIIAANTPHIVFDDLRPVSPLPLISIVEATRSEAMKREIRRVGLLGTRFTMQAAFYPDVFSRQGIAVSVPRQDEQTWIHEKYVGELLKDVFLLETRQRLLEIIQRMKEQQQIQGIILGGTELPLLLRDDTGCGLPLLDTTRIHVQAVVAELLR
jgi:aspartate racemase